MDFDDNVVEGGEEESKGAGPPYAEEFARADAMALADPELGIKCWNDIGMPGGERRGMDEG